MVDILATVPNNVAALQGKDHKRLTTLDVKLGTTSDNQRLKTVIFKAIVRLLSWDTFVVWANDDTQGISFFDSILTLNTQKSNQKNGKSTEEKNKDRKEKNKAAANRFKSWCENQVFDYDANIVMGIVMAIWSINESENTFFKLDPASLANNHMVSQIRSSLKENGNELSLDSWYNYAVGQQNGEKALEALSRYLNFGGELKTSIFQIGGFDTMQKLQTRLTHFGVDWRDNLQRASDEQYQFILHQLDVDVLSANEAEKLKSRLEDNKDKFCQLAQLFKNDKNKNYIREISHAITYPVISSDAVEKIKPRVTSKDKKIEAELDELPIRNQIRMLRLLQQKLHIE